MPLCGVSYQMPPERDEEGEQKNEANGAQGAQGAQERMRRMRRNVVPAGNRAAKLGWDAYVVVRFWRPTVV